MPWYVSLTASATTYPSAALDNSIVPASPAVNGKDPNDTHCPPRVRWSIRTGVEPAEWLTLYTAFDARLVCSVYRTATSYNPLVGTWGLQRTTASPLPAVWVR